MRVEVEQVPASAKQTLENLIQLYLHDMTEFKPRDVDDAGLFHYKYLDRYWDEPGRYPFLIRVDGLPAGFALVRVEADSGTAMAEFFVVRRHRRRGVGSIAAQRLFDLFPGRWQVREEPENLGAQRFWRQAIDNYTAGHFEDLPLDDDHWRGPVQRFDSRVAETRRSVKEA